MAVAEQHCTTQVSRDSASPVLLVSPWEAERSASVLLPSGQWLHLVLRDPLRFQGSLEHQGQGEIPPLLALLCRAEQQGAGLGLPLGRSSFCGGRQQLAVPGVKWHGVGCGNWGGKGSGVPNGGI